MLHLLNSAFAAAVILGLAAVTAAADMPPIKTKDGELKVESLAKLEHPWGMAYLPDGKLLITEKPGPLAELRGWETVRADRRRTRGGVQRAERIARRRRRSEVRREPVRLSQLRRGGRAAAGRDDGQPGTSAGHELQGG